MSAAIPAIAVRGSTGVSINYGPPSYDIVSKFVKDVSKGCRTLRFSPQGQYFAWVNGQSLKIVNTETWAVISELHRPKACCLSFSPLGTYLMSWEPFTLSNAEPQGSPNLHIFKAASGKLVKAFVHKKQTGWEPQWSADEKICARPVNSDVVFYEDANFERIVNRISCNKVNSFSISPSPPPHHILCYMPGKQGTPSFGRLFRYPKFELTQAVANKSFFQDDKVDFFWNIRGTSALLMTSTEVDKTGASYYGKQALHFIGTTGDTSMVMLSKEGPIHSVAWSPKGVEFCVIYGFMPSRATLFNTKCEPIFEYGTGARNAIYYNLQGNILLMGGFGNLRGSVELWDAPARKLIAKCEAPDTTQLQWSPDGLHFVTATTAPRLRMSNGYKIWHYTGTLLYERPWNSQEELYDVCWQSYPPGTFVEKPISYTPVEGITPSQPQASKQVYRPPSARGRETNFRLHDDDEPPRKPGVEATPSKAAIKQKRKREAQKARRQAEEITNPEEAATSCPTRVPVTTTSSSGIGLTGDPEKDKKIKNIKRKLDAIGKLKELQSTGKALEINQLAKIKTETELLTELKDLSL